VCVCGSGQEDGRLHVTSQNKSYRAASFVFHQAGHKSPNDERNGVHIIVKSCHVNVHTCVGHKKGNRNKT